MVSTTSRSSAACIRLAVRFPDAESAERAAALAYDAGVLGLEEREEAGGITLLLYAPKDRGAQLREALAGFSPAPLALGPLEPVADTDWSEAWKQGLEAVVVSSRLVVRPSFVAHARAPGQAEVVIDPGQAFGTGAHASTRLALEWIDALAPGLAPGTRLLDVGTGSGVLALAAVQLAPVRAIAFDLDPVAVREARVNVARNACADRISLFAGPLDALREAPFDLVVANLLRSESTPLLAGLAARTPAGGRAVFAGLLTSEIERFAALLAAAGFRTEGVRSLEDASGEGWAGLLTRR
jgi:ribosomal protein L11 methyltransferase